MLISIVDNMGKNGYIMGKKGNYVFKGNIKLCDS
jgi:hypothetical protein